MSDLFKDWCATSSKSISNQVRKDLEFIQQFVEHPIQGVGGGSLMPIKYNNTLYI